jgi:cytochrome b561
MSSAKNYPVSWFGMLQLPDLVAPDETLFQQLRRLHHQLFAVLVAVAALHVAGALKHHFIDRNDVLKRMLPFGGVK